MSTETARIEALLDRGEWAEAKAAIARMECELRMMCRLYRAAVELVKRERGRK